MNLNPVSWPLGAKAAGVAVAAMLVGGGVASGLVSATSSSEPGVATYLCAGGGQDLLLQWRTGGSDLDGTYQQAQLSGSAPSEQVNAASGELTGTLDGTAITLAVGQGQPDYGTLRNGTLTINVPQQDGTIEPMTCRTTDVARWNRMVGTLHTTASTDNDAASQAAAEAAQQQQAGDDQQQLSSDVQQLSQDAATLDNDTSLAAAVKQMQADYQIEQNDYQAETSSGCPEADENAETVVTDASSVDTDLSSLQGSENSLSEGDIATVKSDMSAVKNDLSDINSLGLSPAVSTTAALAAGNKALSDSSAALTWATGHGNSIDSQADQLSGTASGWPGTQGC